MRSEVTTRRTRPRNRRTIILDAAFDAFAHDGYHDTSMAMVAARVGISPGALYRHFDSKQQLLGQCLLAGLDDALARLETAYRRSPDDDAVVVELVQVALDRRGLPRLWQLEFRHLHPTDRVAVLLRAARLTEFLRRTVRTQRPELRPADVELLSWAAFSVAASPAYHRLELPPAVAARVLVATARAVLAIDLPANEARAAHVRAHWAASDRPGLDRTVRRERILAAAAHLFTDHGFPGVSIDDIGAAVGITGPAVYHYFDSKAQLLDEIVRRHDEWVHLLVTHALAHGRDPGEALRTLTRNFARFGVDEPDLLAITVSQTRYLPSAAEHRYRQVRQDGIGRWARLLRALRPEVAPPVARMLIRAVTTVVIEAVRNPRLAGRPDLVEALVAVAQRIQAVPLEPARPGK
ncbi:TetR/AcrR family transcriptional regulator [Nocardia sp. NPDC058379]|uniref:TetR/AcrR family transcriptional regulator n=1 Tax=unclassified Nocardia TaxID=2637762 RepID=UPI00365D0852